MEEKNIPQQHEGTSTDTVSTKTFDNLQSAKVFYQVVKKRMICVNTWDKWAGKTLADFKLHDASGTEVSREPREGDYFSINIPGPGNPSGDGRDWVRVKQVEETHSEEASCFTMTVQPAPSPLNNDDDVAHFFSEEASSTFIVRRRGHDVSAEVYGRNEKPNVKDVDVSDKVRNAVVAVGGILGFSKIQWKSLTEGLIREE